MWNGWWATKTDRERHNNDFVEHRNKKLSQKLEDEGLKTEYNGDDGECNASDCCSYGAINEGKRRSNQHGMIQDYYLDHREGLEEEGRNEDKALVVKGEGKGNVEDLETKETDGRG